MHHTLNKCTKSKDIQAHPQIQKDTATATHQQHFVVGVGAGALGVQGHGQHVRLARLEQVRHGLRVVRHGGHGREEVVRVEPERRGGREMGESGG